MARPRLNPDWLATAEKVREELGDVEFGGRERIFRRYAESRGISVASLRRDVTAAGFIALVEQARPGFSATLRKLSSSAVTELARLYKNDPDGAVAKASAVAKGLLTGAQMTSGRAHRPIQVRRQERQRQKRSFFEFIETHERRITGYWRDGVYGVPDTRLVFLDNIEPRGVVAFAHIGERDANVAQLLTYLGLLRHYDFVFLGIGSRVLPPKWARYLYLTDPKCMRVLDPEGLGIFIYGPSTEGFSNLIETHTWPEHEGHKWPEHN